MTPQQPPGLRGTKKILMADGSVRDEYGNIITADSGSPTAQAASPQPAPQEPQAAPQGPVTLSTTPQPLPPQVNPPAAPQAPQGPRGTLAPPTGDLTSMLPSTGGSMGSMVNIPAELLRALTFAAGLIPGGGGAATLARMGLTGAGGMATAAAEGGDVGMEGAIQAGMEGTAGVLKPLLMRGGTAAGLTVGGGLLGKEHGRFKKAVDAFVDEANAEPIWKNPVPIAVGQQGRTERALQANKAKLDTALRASPGQVTVDDMKGATNSMADINVGYPKDLESAIKNNEADFIRQQTDARISQRTPSGRPRRGAQPDPINMRELQDVIVDLQHRGAAKSVRDAQKSGGVVSPADQTRAQLDITRGDKFKSSLRDPNVPEAKGLDESLSRQYRMQEANQTLRAGGSTFGDPATTGGRAGLGYMLAKATGTNPGLAMMLTMLGLSPEALSMAGLTTGKWAPYAPTVVRGSQAVTRRSPEKKKKP